jgi:hypothetical protein
LPPRQPFSVEHSWRLRRCRDRASPRCLIRGGEGRRVWTDYGLMLMVAAAIFAVLAAFKNFAERQNTKIVLIADEQQSFWSHAAQPYGTTIT